MFKLRRRLESGAVIPQVTAAYFEQNGRNFILLALNATDLAPVHEELPLHHLYCIEIEHNKDDSWMIKEEATNYTRLEVEHSALDTLHINEMAILKPANSQKNQVYVVGFDDYSGVIRGWYLTGDNPSRGLRIDLLLNQYILAALPQEFIPRHKFSNGGKALFDPDSVTFRIVPNNSEHSETYKNIEVKLEGASSLLVPEPRTPEELKLASRVNWYRSLPDAREQLYKEGRTDYRVSLGPFLDPWLNKELSVRSTFNRRESRMLTISIPKLVQMYAPQVGLEVALEVMNRFDALFGKVGPKFTYMKLPEKVAAHAVWGLLQQELRQSNGGSFSDDETLHYLILDARYLESKLEFDQIMNSVNMLLNSNKSHTIQVITIVGQSIAEWWLSRLGGVRDLSGINHEVVSINASIPKEQAASIVSISLEHGKYGLSVDPQDIIKLVSLIETETAGALKPLSDLDLFTAHLTTILHISNTLLNDAKSIESASKAYRRIAGDHTVEEFSHDVINRALQIKDRLSSTSPLREPYALNGLDSMLEHMQRQIVTWMGYEGPKGVRPGLVFTWMGTGGTGKTALSLALAKWLQARVEMVNATQLSANRRTQEYSRYQIEPEALLVEAVQQKIDELRLDPNPVRILIIDEVHAAPTFLRALMTATGDGDSRNRKSLRLDGLIVIQTMNIDESDTLGQLSNLKTTDINYPSFVKKLYCESYGSLLEKEGYSVSSVIDKKMIEAASTRLLPGMYFFPSIGQKQEQIHSIIYSEVQRVEQEYGVRIILHPKTIDALQSRIRAYAAGNFRTVNWAVRNSIAEAMEKFFRENGLSEISGRTLILQAGENNAAPKCKFIDLRHDPEGVRYVIDEAYNAIVSRIKTALRYHIDSNKRSPADDGVESNQILRHYEVMLNSFSLSSEQPLFNDQGDAIHGEISIKPGIAFQLPHVVEANKRARLGLLLGQDIRGLFKEFYVNHSYGLSDNSGGGGPVNIQEIEHVLASASLVLRANLDIYMALQKMEPSSFSGSSVPAWYRPYLEAYLLEQADSLNREVRDSEIQFLEKEIENWRVLQSALDSQSLDKEKLRISARWGSDLEKHTRNLMEQYSAIQDTTIKRFVDLLYNGNEQALIGFVEEAKSKAEQSTTIDSINLSQRFPITDWPRITSGFALDSLVRLAVKELWEELRDLQYSTLNSNKQYPLREQAIDTIDPIGCSRFLIEAGKRMAQDIKSVSSLNGD